jgi:5-methylcytosine-specific restriction protein B
LSKPAFVRLGPSSAKLSQQLSIALAGEYSSGIEIECGQVPNDFGPGSPVWLWLGSDNNKGQATAWTQGIRAIARCAEKEDLGDKKFRVRLDDIYMLPRSVEKLELLQASPETYARSLSDAAIIGLNNYSSQVVQILTEDEFATIAAIIARLLPEDRDKLFTDVPAAAGIKLIARPQPVIVPVDAQEPPLLSDDDPIYRDFARLANDDQAGGVLLVGVPGTGKSWYARQIAKKLTGGDATRIREVQFHPSYQYEDFVEGYVPDPAVGFRLADKHLLQMIDVADKTDGPVVLIMDEFSRTDPARVLGEMMTYMEGTMRNVSFYLPSGREVRIPKNLLFLATMNPDDRSVDEIDDAMDRRWSKISLSPDPSKVRDFLVENGCDQTLIGPTVNFFVELQRRVSIGHAFFRKVKDRSSLSRLWDMQLRYFLQKRFRFDAPTLQEVEALWNECNVALDEVQAAPVEVAAGEPVTSADDNDGLVAA